jgi:hypothetical protein
MKNLKENGILFENAMVLAMADNIKVANYDPNKLWEIMCDMFNIDCNNEDLGSMFDGIWENLYIKTDILSLGAEGVTKMAVKLIKNNQ